jgi:hypothetical protein
MATVIIAIDGSREPTLEVRNGSCVRVFGSGGYGGPSQRESGWRRHVANFGAGAAPQSCPWTRGGRERLPSAAGRAEFWADQFKGDSPKNTPDKHRGACQSCRSVALATVSTR